MFCDSGTALHYRQEKQLFAVEKDAQMARGYRG
jgi:hypothetical protein